MLTTSGQNTGIRYAAVMGDIVGSEEVHSAIALYEQLNMAVDKANRTEANLVSPLTITLGDEFQGLTTTLLSGLRLVRTLRLQLLEAGFECRFALGLVQLETPLNRERAWNMMGPGLSATREKIADKRHPNAYRFHIPTDRTVEGLLDAVGYSLSLVEQGWTERQQQTAAAFVRDNSSASEIATMMGISTRALYKNRSAAHYDFYSSQWATLEQTMSSIDTAMSLG